LDGGKEHVLTTPDGLSLRGSYFRATTGPCLGVVAFCHGLGEDRWGVVPYAKELLARGFDLFSFDFRNHGASDAQPGYRPMPWLTESELTDVQTVIQYLVSRSEAGAKGIVLIGVSKGANAALCTAAGNPTVRAIVTDGAFPTGALQRHYVRRFMHIYLRLPLVAEYLPDACLISFCMWAKFLYWLRSGCRIVDVERLVRSVRQPVFMIHGERDGYVPKKIAERLRRRLPGRSKLWIVQGVNHNGAASAMGASYVQRIAKFLVWSSRDSNAHMRRRRNRRSWAVSRLLKWWMRPVARRPASSLPART
jgi:pimeloyl-ACP methyl ester carboxylesterase